MDPGLNWTNPETTSSIFNPTGKGNLYFTTGCGNEITRDTWNMYIFILGLILLLLNLNSLSWGLFVYSIKVSYFTTLCLDIVFEKDYLDCVKYIVALPFVLKNWHAFYLTFFWTLRCIFFNITHKYFFIFLDLSVERFLIQLLLN